MKRRRRTTKDVGNIPIGLRLTDAELRAGLADARGEIAKMSGHIRAALSLAGGIGVPKD